MTDRPRGEDQQRRRAIQQVWTEGDYDVLARRFQPISERLMDEVEARGLRVLDAATGTGNTAIAAARRGASVDAFDLAPRLLEIAARRAEEAGVGVVLREGDLLDIPYPDDEFDLVVSTFGAFTVDDPQGCADELVRVCRSSGTIVTTAWAPDSCFDVMVDVALEHAPDLFDPTAPSPRWWAQPEGLAHIFDGHGVTIDIERDTEWLGFASVEAALSEVLAVSGPMQRLADAVESRGAGLWGRAADEVRTRWSALARHSDQGVDLPAVYVVATIHMT